MRLLAAAALALSAFAVALPAQAAGAFTENFEGGSLPSGWRIVSGSFGRLITDRATFHNDARPYNKEGRFFLSTLETPAQTPSDGYRGVVVSAPFTVVQPVVTMLVGGGGADTYVAVCAYDETKPDGCGQELAVTRGNSAEVMARRQLDVSAHVGRRVIVKAVDDSTGGWGHITLDDIRNDLPATPGEVRVARTAGETALSWGAAIGGGTYAVYRSTERDSGFTRLGEAAEPGFTDRTARPGTAYFYAVSSLSSGVESSRVYAYARPYSDLRARGETVTYAGQRLTDTRFPVGPLGSAGIVHDGTGARPTWWIFNNLGRGGWHLDADSYAKGKLPNSFFAVRAKAAGGEPVVRALQTTGVGAFEPVKSLTQQGEYPILKYRYKDESLPVKVSSEILNPMIPGNVKDSAIPTAIYNITVQNPGDRPAEVSVLAAQQNAVGFNGYDTIGGANNRVVAGYGANRTVVDGGSLRMTGADGAGGMNLAALAGGVTGTAAWSTLEALRGDLADDGALSGPADASGPAANTTVDGALATAVTLKPGESKTIPVVLSWHFPNAQNFNGGSGRQYENWWNSADAVADYVKGDLERLVGQTKLYHDTVYDSNLPQYVLDRITSATSVLHSPTVWWAKNGFFGAREGWGCCPGMPTHVFHYAQSQAWLWPEVGRRWTQQWLDNADDSGKIPMRFDSDSSFTLDGQTGVILSAYRTYQTTDQAWLAANWPKIKQAMEYVVRQADPDRDGVLTGIHNTTLDGGETGNGSWLGSLYLASVNASAKMAELAGDGTAKAGYDAIYASGRVKQERQLFNGEYFQEAYSAQGHSYGDGVAIDMLLGQWWSTQLGLGDIYDSAKMTTAARNLFRHNFKEHFTGYNDSHQFRQYVEETDAGLQMISWPNSPKPGNSPLYYDEVMSGFEYSAAGLMLQRGLLDEGLRVVKAASDRYDGRARTEHIDKSPCSTGDGTGSPFGDDECGKWYGRTLSSWSLLTALQGFTFDGPAQKMSFAPNWKPQDHRSFFSTGTAWGTFTQKRAGRTQDDRITVKHGAVTLKTVSVALSRAGNPKHVKVHLDGRKLGVTSFAVDGATLTVTLPRAVTLRADPRRAATAELAGSALRVHVVR
ncbi:GH116 family glycosyl-hydrolase [Nonomuraea sp. NPDC050547]|uniref:GH116 family glycosyl-hydrolase n=1 Tax=Nonomuraea sp. NPDC050547 TaxID=3364368 RepID=UPI0037AE1ECD